MSTAPAHFTILGSSMTVPVVPDPSAETHWTCPAAPDRGVTHHMTFPNNTCRYCRAGAGVLRGRQQRLLGVAIDVAGTRIPLWQVTGWERDGNSVILSYETDDHRHRTQISHEERDRIWSLLYLS